MRFNIKEWQDKYVKQPLNEGKKPIPKFTIAADIEEYFDKIPAFKKYKNKNASYDDEIYEIPTSVFTKVLGWTEKDVKRINQNLEAYEGTLDWENTNPNKYKENQVTLMGGA